LHRLLQIRSEEVHPERLAQPLALPRARPVHGLLDVVGQLHQDGRDVVESAVGINERLQVRAEEVQFIDTVVRRLREPHQRFVGGGPGGSRTPTAFAAVFSSR
jgi:hypothetical protein